MVLIFSLCFALVIYNAYAAFITSVLSVRVASIRGLGDLLESDFHFGYPLGGQDEAFLRVGNLGVFILWAHSAHNGLYVVHPSVPDYNFLH
jgi:hypothetical protein